jgi:hypothetical protein
VSCCSHLIHAKLRLNYDSRLLRFRFGHFKRTNQSERRYSKHAVAVKYNNQQVLWFIFLRMLRLDLVTTLEIDLKFSCPSLFYLYIYHLFNDAVNTPGASNARMIIK